MKSSKHVSEPVLVYIPGRVSRTAVLLPVLSGTPRDSNRQKLYVRLLMNGKPLRDGQYVPDLRPENSSLPREKWVSLQVH